MANEILITGGAGFIGQALVSALLAADSSLNVTLTDVVQPPIPAGQESRVTSLKADLTDPSAVASLLDRRFAAVYILHGLMSGGAEANLDLGLRVNVDSVRVILDRLRASHPSTVVVFASSCAVYGKADPVRELETLPQPKSSYGAEKLIVELLLNDYSRRGLLDGRIVRLPTVIVRPGAPSAAASSFASGIVRESLQGVKNVLPVARDLEMWVCSPDTVVANLVLVKDVPASRFGGSRILNLPGITVSVQDILDGLQAVAGAETVALIKEERDPKVEAIVGSWPARFDTKRANDMGMKPDISLADNFARFAARNKAA